MFCYGSIGCFKCGQSAHFNPECHKNKQGDGNGGNRSQSSSVAPQDKAAFRGATSGTGGGTSFLYAIKSRQEQEHFPNIFTGMIQVIDFIFYAFLHMIELTYCDSLCCYEFLYYI